MEIELIIIFDQIVSIFDFSTNRCGYLDSERSGTNIYTIVDMSVSPRTKNLNTYY